MSHEFLLRRLRLPFLPLLAAFAITAAPALAEDACEGGGAEPPDSLAVLLRPTRLGCALDRARIRPFGWVEASVSATPGLDADDRTARVFDVEAEGFRLHQAGFGIERLPDADRRFDLGGRVAALWGTDARWIHARGLLDEQDGREQFDLLEAKVLARLPVACGLTVAAGKLVTPLGYEVIEAPGNSLASRSFLFGYAIPFTHAGVLATLEAGPRWKVAYGLVEGWDVWDDNNDAWSHLAGVSWTSASGDDALALNAVVGPEREDDESDLRAVVDAIWTRSWPGGAWTTALNADLGFEDGAAPDGGDAMWYGVAAYVTRVLSDRLSATLRAEWFRDEDGARLGEPASLGEATLGVSWRPVRCLPGLAVRPELRWDHSFDGAYFDGGEDEDQFSVCLDVVFRF